MRVERLHEVISMSSNCRRNTNLAIGNNKNNQKQIINVIIIKKIKEYIKDNEHIVHFANKKSDIKKECLEILK